ncbi:MAG: dienelactone hydrolase family protein [Bryobacterales bacterium]|nr:dienelactone hydrolase family protein [Bryobacterales bacterium]
MLVVRKLAFGLTVALALAWTAPIRDEAALPADAESAEDRLAATPRHGEWVEISEGQGASGGWHDRVRAWISYPERATRAPVVIVIHEIFGLTDWVRGVADQLAGAGYIAIAPDLLTGLGPDGQTPSERQEAVQLIRGLRIEDVARRLTAVGRFGAGLPASNGKFGVIGFCWGGGTAFAYAGYEPNLAAAVVYYGTSPDKRAISRITAPVAGFYGSEDMRVNSTIPAAEAEMQRLGLPFENHIYEGAGHGFLRQQSGREGANLKASESAWAATVAFLGEHLESR